MCIVSVFPVFHHSNRSSCIREIAQQTWPYSQQYIQDTLAAHSNHSLRISRPRPRPRPHSHLKIHHLLLADQDRLEIKVLALHSLRKPEDIRHALGTRLHRGRGWRAAANTPQDRASEGVNLVQLRDKVVDPGPVDQRLVVDRDETVFLAVRVDPVDGAVVLVGVFPGVVRDSCGQAS